MRAIGRGQEIATGLAGRGQGGRLGGRVAGTRPRSSACGDDGNDGSVELGEVRGEGGERGAGGVMLDGRTRQG